ncbi:MAG: HD domain-containing protein [Sandaracinaceae bacterium]|nr:HD domain-containing protein [Sandaracinaceae bacterium]
MSASPASPPGALTRAALLDLIAGDPALTTIMERVAPRLAGDSGHDVEHALRVARAGLQLGEGHVDEREMIAAALLHDVVNLPKDHPDRALASEQSAAMARTWLLELGFAPEAAARVGDAVRTHSFSRGEAPTSALGDALQDADRLEALGVIGVFRTISTGTHMGANYFHASDPWAVERALDDKRYSVDHFFTKLFGLAETMRTDAGRAEATRRADVMRTLLTQLGRELGVPLQD